MRIGVPKEIKTLEFRVGATPGLVQRLVHEGHEVFVERGAAAGIGISDDAYAALGAKLLPDADAVFEAAEMIVKVKEPQPIEIARLKPHHILFTYLHLAADKDQAEGLMACGCTAIAYETVTDLGPAAAAGPDSKMPAACGGRQRLPSAEGRTGAASCGRAPGRRRG